MTLIELRMYIVQCTIGWVNLYKKFEIEKFTVCGKFILPTKMKRHLKKKFAQLYCEFAWVCELPVFNTFKDMHSKI